MINEVIDRMFKNNSQQDCYFPYFCSYEYGERITGSGETKLLINQEEQAEYTNE